MLWTSFQTLNYCPARTNDIGTTDLATTLPCSALNSSPKRPWRPRTVKVVVKVKEGACVVIRKTQRYWWTRL